MFSIIIRQIQQQKCSKIILFLTHATFRQTVSAIIRRYYKNVRDKTDTQCYNIWHCNSCLKLKIMFKIPLR